jgi:hypothetical protein
LGAKVCTCAEEAEPLAVVFMDPFFGWSRRDVRYSPGEWRCHKNQVKITKITSRLADGFGLADGIYFYSQQFKNLYGTHLSKENREISQLKEF